MTSLKITNHALAQLGNRYKLAWDRTQAQAALARSRPIFTISAGQVYAINDPLCYVVVRDGSVVTAIGWAQAFADCPRAVFAHMIRQGMLNVAFGYRDRLRNGTLPSAQDPLSARYPKACDTIWCAFKYLEAR